MSISKENSRSNEKQLIYENFKLYKDSTNRENNKEESLDKADNHKDLN